MEFTAEDRKELETILDIVINKIPNYFNLINSVKDDWNIDSIEDCVFGMAFNSFVAKSTEYLTNKQIDDAQEASLDSTVEKLDTTIEIFSEKVAEIKQAIVSTSNL